MLISDLDTSLFCSRSKDDLAKEIDGCLERAPSDNGFILASGCEVPGIAPPEKVDWYTELVDDRGRCH